MIESTRDEILNDLVSTQEEVIEHLHAQLAAERARVEEMHKAWDKWMATPSSNEDTWQWETNEWQQLMEIMETRDNAHAQGDDA